MRVDEDQRWSLFHLFQPIWHVGNALLFEYGIAAYDLELGGYMAKRKRMTPRRRPNGAPGDEDGAQDPAPR